MMRVAALAAAAVLLALASPAAAHCNYVVQEGETLSSIAKGYEIDLENITAINTQITNPDLIYEGDVVRLPCDEDLPKESDINELLAHRSDTFYVFTAIQKAGLAEEIADGSLKWTVFAPTDDAFEAFLAEKDLNLTTVLADAALLGDILKYHVTPDAALKAEKLEDGQEVSTLLDDQTLTIGTTGGVTVKTTSGQTAKVVVADLRGGKSVIHLVDAVLIPGDKKPAPAPKPAEKPTTPVNPGKVPCKYTVVKDDTLFDLAAKFGTTVEDLLKLNPTIKNEDLIIEGSEIVLKKC